MVFSLELDLIILAVLLFLSGFFSAAETALVSVTSVKLRRMVKRKLRGSAALEKLKSNPHKMLITVLIGNNLVNITAAAFATAVAIGLFESNALGIATGVMTFLILVFGEITPKSLALKHSEGLSLFLSKPLLWLSRILTPLIWLLDLITGTIIRAIGGEPIEKGITEEEIKTAVSMGAEEGAINAKEKEMIHRVLQFNDTTVEQIMVARKEIVAIPSTMKLKDFVNKYKKKPFSRMPVYDGNLDTVEGVFYVKDAIARFNEGATDLDVKAVMRKLIFVPTTKKLDKLLKEFQDSHAHMAIVVGEYGDTLGLVTIEDLLEELVGEIIDEMEIETRIKKIGSSTFIVDGKTELDLLKEETGLSLSSKKYRTVGGYIIESLGRIPKKGEKIECGTFTLVVESILGQQVVSVRIIKEK